MSASDIAVSAEGLSKVYRIGLKDQAHDSLAGALIDFVRSPVRNYRKYRSLYRFDDVGATESNGARAAPADIVWALRDVSFEIKHGEVVAFVGRNGAGKSTLLKILSRITPPTRGRAEIRGRVASLLEVGTGFHYELTGRENVYLNGTILGMTKKEIDRKFDEIVDFSGIERFIDTPVKRYSSGMAVRLAFSVAAHLEPEILIVDEVLAVGDAAFQQKCINKMQDVGKQGRTILFVSHNMAAVNMLCSRAILIRDGTIGMAGSPDEVIAAYVSTGTGLSSSREWSDPTTAPAGEVARLRAIRVVSRDGKSIDAADIRSDIGLEMVFDVMQPGAVLLPHYLLYNEQGSMVFKTHDTDPAWLRRARPAGTYTSTAWIPGNLLAAGRYFVSVALITRSPDVKQFYEGQIISFNVLDNMGDGTARGDWSGAFGGVVRPFLTWTTRYAGADELSMQRSSAKS
jgi:lipopolysaccharide transport system ATP-binding protein